MVDERSLKRTWRGRDAWERHCVWQRGIAQTLEIRGTRRTLTDRRPQRRPPRPLHRPSRGRAKLGHNHGEWVLKFRQGAHSIYTQFLPRYYYLIIVYSRIPGYPGLRLLDSPCFLKNLKRKVAAYSAGIDTNSVTGLIDADRSSTTRFDLPSPSQICLLSILVSPNPQVCSIEIPWEWASLYFFLTIFSRGSIC